MLADFSSASCIVVWFSDRKEDRQGSAGVIFFQLCIQKQDLKKSGERFEFSSSGLQAQQANAAVEMCSSKRVYVMKKLFLSNYKQNRGPWNNIKLSLIEQLFCYH